MSNKQPASTFSLGRALHKSFVTAFVVFTYAAYAVHERFANSAANVDALASSPNVSVNQPQVTAASPGASRVSPAGTPQAASSTPTLANGNHGLYKDGVFTGAAANAFYGQVQVKVVIQNGRMTDVQFLDYPKDRRTSARINSVAMPRLQTEAIQAQSAKVDIVSGATLTSEAFMASLQSALNSARG